MSGPRLRVSVIIPAHNEETTLASVLERVRAQRIDDVQFEVLVVNDGSTDATREVLEQNPGLVDHCIHLPVNRGKGAAIRAGWDAATGEYVLCQDADLEYDPADYKTLLAPVLHPGADVVMGSRLVAPPITRVHYFWHKVGNRVLTLLFNMLHNTTFTDVYSGYLLMRRNLLNSGEMRVDGWGQQAELLSLVARRANVLYEVPISYFGRSYAEGKKIRARHFLSVVMAMITTRLLRK